MSFLMAILLPQNMSHHTALESIVFSLVTSPRIEQQQLSINKFSLNFTRYHEIVATISLYVIPGARCKKKIRIIQKILLQKI